MFKKKEPIKQLQERSSQILNVFTSTVQDLSLTNSVIQEEIDTREQEIKRLTGEQATLSNLFTSNQKIADKIVRFLSTDEED